MYPVAMETVKMESAKVDYVTMGIAKVNSAIMDLQK